MSQDFVAADGHRWWINPRNCNHSNENVCASCDFDDYYANTYPSVPWREIHPDEEGGQE